jgi:hypothetical protein
MPRLSKIGAAALAAFGWTGLQSVTASYLVVAGGGGGGASYGGGGGAGGLLTSTTSLNPTQSYAVTVGAGGAGSTNSSLRGTVGSNSVLSGTGITTLTSTGGGGGGSANDSTGQVTGGNGGSGGGGAANATGGTVTSSGGTGNTPSTSPSQGSNGGSGETNSLTYRAAGGGGGASAVGVNGNSSAAGNGGAGTASSISGSSVTYAGGGGGGSSGSTAGTGGAGGGGNGVGSGSGNAGTANSGGGGGGASANNGGKGGSGIVIISYPAPQQFGGGVVTTSGANVIHTFNTSGTLTPLSSLTASYLIVAGGGGGGSATSGTGGTGAGGAGGLLSGSGLTIDSNSIYVVTVGAGGGVASNAVGTQGTNSSLSAYATSAVGGGYGGKQSDGGAGGSGGGAGYGIWTGGTGTSGQGNAGGNTTVSAGGGAGGGGAGAVGANAITVDGSNGGVGVANPITGSTTGQLVSTTYYVAGGGGGGAWTGGSPGSGGSGGGGGGGTNAAVAGVSGTANTGGGGGGGGGTYPVSGGAGGSGGSGVVIISYAGATQLMAGGTVTISGGNVIHTFTSSGYLTPIKLVNNSLRFKASATAYLSKTLTTPTNNKIWTWSSWVKRGTLSSAQVLLSSDVGTSNTTWLEFGFDAADTFTVTAYSADSNTTSAVFRDPSAWYHIIVAFDSTQATSANRCKIYVNGVQQTLTGSGFTLNAGYGINSAQATAIGFRNWTPSGRYFDGYLTEINFVDGQQLAPTSFGTTNSYGVWQPITYGGSYGTNGFYLPFTNNTNTTTIGYDFSPNGNNWTSSGINVTAYSGTPPNNVNYDSMTDVPTLTSATAANYATLNPLAVGSSATLSDASLKIAGLNSANVGASYSTIGMTTGKWYFEVTAVGVGSNFTYALVEDVVDTSALNVSGSIFAGYRSTGDTYGTVSITTTTWNSAGVVIGVAVDCDNGAVYFANANTWINSGVPTSGASRTGAITTYTAGTKTLFGGVGCFQNSSQSAAINFGQRPFSYTPPTNFVALNTYNL